MSRGAMVPRFAFDNGVLFLQVGGYRARMRLRPTPLAEEEDQHGRWRECWPTVRLIFPDGSMPPPSPVAAWDGDAVRPGASTPDILHGCEALAAFRGLVPERVAQCVEPFRSHQWALLALLHEVKEVMGWAVDNPVLAYCVANNGEFRAIGDDVAAVEARHHCMRKQTAILKWLRFPSAPAIVRLLKNILPAAAEPSRLRMLRTAIVADPEILDVLSSRARIGVGALALLSHREMRRLVTPRLLAEVAAKGDERLNAPVADMLVGILRDSAQFQGRIIPRPFHSVRAVKECHGDVTALAKILEEERRLREKKMNPAMSPPIPGSAHIVPLESKALLAEEGRIMQNCIATYYPSIRKGQNYAYRILSPNRATLLIRKGWDGRWHCQDLRLKANRMPPRDLELLVAGWLSTGIAFDN